jgi:thiamine-monophosphate kinase
MQVWCKHPFLRFNPIVRTDALRITKLTWSSTIWRFPLNSHPDEKPVEHKLIDRIKDWTGERLIGDDCAVLPGGSLVTADTLVEGNHFVIPGISFEDLGWKAVAVNLSDIAAMSGRPRFIIINLTLPHGITDLDFERMFRSMIDCAQIYRCRIVGGDLTRGAQLVLTLTVIGDKHENGVMTRRGASIGDILITTGDFGASAAGLWLMQNETEGFFHCRQKHFRPLPRLCESWFLIRTTAGTGAMMDASDGLADAVIQLAQASDVGIRVRQDLIPIDEQTKAVAARAGANCIDWALYGGEDYELVACVNAQHWQAMKELPANPFREIGMVTEAAPGVVLVAPGGEESKISLSRTYQHWRA